MSIIKTNDRVRYVDQKKDEEYGVLFVFAIKGGYAMCGKGDYENLGKASHTVKLSELKKA